MKLRSDLRHTTTALVRAEGREKKSMRWLKSGRGRASRGQGRAAGCPGCSAGGQGPAAGCQD